MSEDAGPWWKRLGWLILIWALSVATVGAIAGMIRWWLVS